MKYFQRKVSRCDGLYGIASCRAVPVNRVSNRHRVKPPDDLPRFALEQTRLQDPPSRQESKEACLVQSEGKRTQEDPNPHEPPEEWRRIFPVSALSSRLVRRVR